jgi:hypothetical protein
MASSAGFGAQPRQQSEPHPSLETVWNGNQLRLDDLADPFRMTNLLKSHFSATPASGDVEGAQ